MKLSHKSLGAQRHATCAAATAALRMKLDEADQKYRAEAETSKFINDTRAKIQTLQSGCKLGDLETAKEIVVLKEALKKATDDYSDLASFKNYEHIQWRELYYQHLDAFRPLADSLHRETAAGFEKALTPVLGKADAERVALLTAPVQALDGMRKACFFSVAVPEDPYFAAIKLMVNMAEAALGNEWDPLKWHLDQNGFPEFGLPPAEIQMEEYRAEAESAESPQEHTAGFPSDIKDSTYLSLN